jgi:hypothetical protein
MFMNQSHTIIENQCRDVYVTVFVSSVYELKFFFLNHGSLETGFRSNVRYKGKTRLTHFGPSAIFLQDGKPVMKKSRRCPK